MSPTLPESFAIDVMLEPVGDDFDALGREWRELESRAQPSFFTSWTWIGSWLRSLPPGANMLLLRARCAGQTMALATFGHARQRRRAIVNSRALFLNEADYAGQDLLTIEYNGILASTARHAATLRAIATFLLARREHWNEIYMHGTSGLPTLFEHDQSLTIRNWHKDAPRVRLAAVRERTGDYLGLLKQKPRYQIRRSRRLYETQGGVSVETAKSLEEARLCLDAMISLHTPYWQGRGATGSFSTPFELGFHRRLVEAGFERGEIQLATVRCGDRTVGCLYNFVHRGHVYNYQSGFDYKLFDGKDNPGLLSHAMAIELNATLGHDIYDFLAGDQRYKRDLCTEVEQLHWSVIQRPELGLRMENALRRVRQHYLKRAA